MGARARLPARVAHLQARDDAAALGVSGGLAPPDQTCRAEDDEGRRDRDGELDDRVDRERLKDDDERCRRRERERETRSVRSPHAQTGKPCDDPQHEWWEELRRSAELEREPFVPGIRGYLGEKNASVPCHLVVSRLHLVRREDERVIHGRRPLLADVPVRCRREESLMGGGNHLSIGRDRKRGGRSTGSKRHPNSACRSAPRRPCSGARRRAASRAPRRSSWRRPRDTGLDAPSPPRCRRLACARSRSPIPRVGR